MRPRVKLFDHLFNHGRHSSMSACVGRELKHIIIYCTTYIRESIRRGVDLDELTMRLTLDIIAERRRHAI